MTGTAKFMPHGTNQADLDNGLSAEGKASRLADSFCALGTVKSLKKGEVNRPTADDDSFVLIAAGSAKLIAKAPSGHTHVLGFHFSGEVVSLRRKENDDFQLVALTDLRLVIVPALSLLDSLQQDPLLLQLVLKGSFQALHHSRTKLMRLSCRTARERVAGFLLSIADRAHNCQGNSCVLTLSMSRKDMGDNLGLAIETISRQLTELREAGLIETQGRGTVTLLDIEKLAMEAGQNRPDRKLQQI